MKGEVRRVCYQCWWFNGGKCFCEELGELPEKNGKIIGHTINVRILVNCMIKKTFIAKNEMNKE